MKSGTPRNQEVGGNASQVAGGNVVNIRDGAAVGQVAGGDIHNHITARGPTIRPVVQPGDGCLSAEQKGAIAAKRDEWMALHATLKKRPLSPSRAWIMINRSAGVNSYHLIPADKFDSVMAFIGQQMAVLRQMATAPAKDKDWRAKRIAAIKARCKNQLGDVDAYKPYIKKRFGADSLAVLATDELQATYAYVMAKKRG